VQLELAIRHAETDTVAGQAVGHGVTGQGNGLAFPAGAEVGDRCRGAVQQHLRLMDEAHPTVGGLQDELIANVYFLPCRSGTAFLIGHGAPPLNKVGAFS
jgi:hypothetical protein